ncbi:hypothetical protein ACFLIM_19000 [Nonomuraea sp. M3C6]|uniref:MFS transporter n=1 Tax=Nonomuraea marmarensis TaxID=3351344 RepID=A0ABW7AD71_9ACTN
MFRVPPRPRTRTPAEHLGRAFGVQRTMDAAGAVLGPLAALGVLALSGQTYGRRKALRIP